jgi:two-component system cell cycle sensor histidine kinase/response regulator CckA
VSPKAKTVLIVDDDEPTRKLLDALMRRSALSCLAASNGQAAIEVLESRDDVACIILDLMMPTTDGSTVIAYLARTGKRIPVIVCTAMLPSTMPALDPAIVRTVIRKPFDVEQMAETVMAFIE